MNDQALELGLANTHFDNPNGLDSENHHTTARELAKLTAYAMENEEFRKIVGTQSYTMEGRTMTNHNKLLRLYPDAVGVKTGFTSRSGRCLVSAAERHGRRLIAVTLHDPDDWNDHISMLESAFAQFQEYTLHLEGQALGEVPCEGGDRAVLPYHAQRTLTCWLTPEEYDALEIQITGSRFVYAPTVSGDDYGVISYLLNGRPLMQDSLLFSQSASMLPERRTRLEIILEKIRSFFDRL